MQNDTQQQEEIVVVPDAEAPVLPLQNTRRARALIGWMVEDQALRTMCSGRMDLTPSDEQRDRAASARASVASREVVTADPDALPVIEDAPQDVVLAFGEARLAQLRAAGHDVKIVDLEQVRAFQTHVLDEQAVERVQGVDADDLTALTELTLPAAGTKANISVMYDESQRAWIILWPDQNLRVLTQVQGNITDEAGNSFPTFGFAVGALPSLVQVCEYQGRYVLTDGYHRAFGLLSRGISRVPVLFRRVDNFEEMNVPPGMLPQAQWLGARPPRLGDYLDDEVAETVDVVSSQRLITVQAMQASPLG